MVKKMKPHLADQEICSIYGSRQMTAPIPKFKLPEHSLDKDLAYQLIHDEINLDSHPGQNLASFCTTWMEDEANKLIQESLNLNLADEDEYPHTIKIHERCVNILGHLFNAPIDDKEPCIGVSAIGSSEAVMLAGLAMKWNWRKRQQAKGKDTSKPNLVMSETVQVVWDKFARYFEVEPKLIPVEKGEYVLTPEKVLEYVDENTIGVCAILGSTFTGEFEPIKAINDALEDLQQKTGLDIPLHVDAASGGFVAPFLYPDLEWDFRLSKVVSINVSGHKYGLVYPGIGWVLWRSQDALPEELIFHVNYLGGDMPTFTLNFSRSAAFVIAQYYNFIRLGRSGYTNIMVNLKTISDFIDKKMRTIDDFEIVSSTQALPLVAWKVKENMPYNAYQLSDKLRQFGWVVPAYSMPDNAKDEVILRVVVREHFSRELADDLIDDIERSILQLKGEKPNLIEPASEKKSVKIC